MTAAVLAWPFVGRRAELERIEDALDDERIRAVLITGRSGVGKSRLAEEGLEAARGRGRQVAHVTATSVAATVPLSVLSPILPPRIDLADPYALFATVRDQLLATAAGGGAAGPPPVLVVDDADLLDATSAALLAFLLAERALFVIATFGAGTTAPEPLDALWRGGRAIRVELGSFDRAGVEVLLHFALRGPVTAPAAQALWDASQGNVLYLRELVTTARDEGALSTDDGVWTLRRDLGAGAGVSALVERRVRDLGPPERAVLDLLAACGPLGIDDVAAHAPTAALARLESLELIAVSTAGRRQQVALVHPLHARVLRAAMPRLAARALLLGQIERIRGYGAKRRGDELRLASWLLDATGTADPELLARAAALAHYVQDGERAEQLAEAALRAGPNALASVVLAEARAEGGDRQGAEEVLAAAFDTAPALDLDTVAWSRAMNLFFGLGRLADARACLAEAVRRNGPAVAPVHAAMEALILSFAGRPTEALALLGPDEPSGAEPRLRVLWLLARSHALVETGRVDDAESAAIRAREEHLRLENRTALPNPAVHLANLAHARLVAGRFAEAAEAAERGQREAADAGAGSLAVWFCSLRAWIELGRGRLDTAAAHFRAGLAEANRFATGPGGPTPYAAFESVSVAAGLTLARLLTGDEEAAAVLDEAVAAAGPAGPDVADLVPVQRARAWATAQAGDLAAARDRLRRTATAAAAAGSNTIELRVLYDVVRLGGAAEVAARLAELGDAMQGALPTAQAAHARAAASGSAPALVEVAATLADLGADLFAAEAYTAAAERLRARGEARAGARAAARAAELAAACAGARTPGLMSPDTVSPLSPREREIAVFAARGVPSREIAERLFLSVRTVNNHLQSVYGKLGVSTRGELSAALGLSDVTKEARG